MTIAPVSSAAEASPTLRVVHDERDIDVRSAQAAVAQLLRALGLDPTSEQLRDTPTRVAVAYAELLTPQSFSLTTFPNDEQYDELVLARDIPFVSVCEHHLLPFRGVAHVGYVPAERILGLSKLARVVDFFARRLQLQERLTTQIAQCLSDELRPRGVGVVLVAEHSCMSQPAPCVREHDRHVCTSRLAARRRALAGRIHRADPRRLKDASHAT